MHSLVCHRQEIGVRRRNRGLDEESAPPFKCHFSENTVYTVCLCLQKMESFCFWVPREYQEDIRDTDEPDISENKNLERLISMEAAGQTGLSYSRS